MTIEETLLNLINTTGGVPIIVQTTQKVAWNQYIPTIILGIISSFFVFYFIFTAFGWKIGNISTKIMLWKIKKITGRNILLIRHQGGGLFDPSMITENTYSKVVSIIEKFKGKPFDLILHTPGGTVFFSMMISRIMKNYPSEIRVFVPSYAASGGTLLTFSGHKIFMDKNACLTPVDPQLGDFISFGSSRSWRETIKKKGKKAEDKSYRMAFTATKVDNLIRDYFESLVGNRIIKSKRRKFMSEMVNGDLAHIHHITPKDLKEYGIKVFDIPEEIRELMLKIVIKPGETIIGK